MTQIRTFRIPTVKHKSAAMTAMSEFAGIMAFVNEDDKNKNDYEVSGGKIEFTERKTLAIPTAKGMKEYGFNAWSFDQLASLLKIPSRYLSDCPVKGPGGMKAQIDLRMQDRQTKNLLIRVRETPTEEGLAGTIRAILPGNYTPFDNRHLVQGVQKAIMQEGGQYELALTNAQDPRSIEAGLNMRLVKRNEFQLDVGSEDPHKMGFHCMTSEIGGSDVRLDALVYRQICTNGMMGWGDSEVLRIKHKNFQSHEVMPQLQEGVLASVRQEAAVKDMLERTYNEPVRDPETFLMLSGKRMKASDFVIDSALELFKNSRSPATKFAVMQAFTQTALSLPLQERTKIEQMVGHVFFGGKATRTVDVPAHATAIDEEN